MKKKIYYVAALLLMSSLSLDTTTSVHTLASALEQMVPQKIAKFSREHDYGSPERAEMLKERIARARKKADLKEFKTPQQAYDEFIITAVSWVELLANDFAAAVADVISKSFHDEKLAQAIRRMPGAIANGILLGYELATRVAFPADVRKKYLDQLNKANQAAQCLALKAGRKAKPNACDGVGSTDEAFAQLLGAVQGLIMPFLEIGLLGVERTDGRMVNSLLVEATAVVAPQYKEQVSLLQDFGRMFKDTLAQTEKLVESGSSSEVKETL